MYRTCLIILSAIVILGTFAVDVSWAQDDEIKRTSGEPFPPILEGLLVVIFSGLLLLIVCKPTGKGAG